MTVEIRINLDADQAEQALQQLQQQSGQSFGKVEQDGQKAASGLSTAFDRATVVLTAITGVIAGVATGVAALTQQVTVGVVDTANYASALGISAQQLGIFETAARRAGGDIDGLREGMRTAQEGISEFVNLGSGPAAEALSVLGVRLTDAQGRTRDIAQAFPELVAALGQVENNADRTRLAIQLFGEEDSRVIVQLAQNPKAFQEAADAAERYGTTISSDIVQQSRQFQTGLVDLQSALGGLGQTIVSALLPTLNQVIPEITAWVAELRNSETLHNTFIPLLQDFVSALGQVDVVVAALQDGWNALVAVLNISLGVLVKVGAALIDLALTPLQRIIDAAALASDVLGFDGVAEKLRNVSRGIDSLTEGAQALGFHILETGTTAVASIGKIADALDDTGRAQTRVAEVTVQGNARAQGSVAETVRAIERMQGVTTDTANKAQQDTQRIAQAYQALGIQASSALQTVAQRAVENFQRIEQSGTETPERLAKIWAEQVIPKIIEAYGSLPPQFQEVDRRILEGAGQTSTEVAKAFDTLGIETTDALRKTAEEAVRAFMTAQQSGQISKDRLARLWVEELAPQIIEAFGRIPPEWAAVNAAMVRVSGQTRSQLEQDFDAYSAVAQDALKRTADAAVREFQRSFDSGRFTTEGLARLWEDELVPRILDAYGTIPPHLAGLNERLVANARQTADAIAAAHFSAAQRSTSFFDAATGQIIERVSESVRSVTAIFAQGLQSVSVLQPFGNTVEELTEQIGKVSEEIDNVRNSIGRGIPTDFITFQVERLQEVLFELIKRRNELLGQGQGSDELRRLLGFGPTGQSGTSIITTGQNGQASTGSALTPLSSGASSEFQRRIDDALRSAGFASQQQFTQRLGQLLGTFGGEQQTLQGVFARFPELQDLFNLVRSVQPGPFSFQTEEGPPNPFLPPDFPTPPTGNGSSRGGSFDGGALDPNLDPLGLGAGGNARRSGATVTFGAGSIVVNTQAKDARVLAQELLPALNEQIRLGALKT